MIPMLIMHFIIFILGLNTTMAIPSKNITEFFPETKGNLTQITWAHAVNSQELLKDALNGTVMMLEADIVLGTHGEDADIIPIMGHPPTDKSDLSLQEFLQAIQDFNSNANNTAKKGIKLDFKTIEVFQASLTIIKDLYPQMDYPVWINADILQGPLNSPATPVDAVKFLKDAKEFENATLSLGWTTEFGGNITKASYTKEQVQEMITTIGGNNVSQDITFPVRAGIAEQSLTQLKLLVNNITGSTLTLWHGTGDHVEIEPLRKLIGEIGIHRVYVDLPNDIKDKLRLNELPSGVSPLKNIALLPLIVTMLTKIF